MAQVVARKHLGKAAKSQKELYDAKLSLNQYKPGDLVWCLSEVRKEGVCTKLQPAYKGPYLVVKKYNDQDCRIQVNGEGKQKVVHHNKLKPYLGNNVPTWVKQATKAVS